MELTRRNTLEAGSGALAVAVIGGHTTTASAESDDDEASDADEQTLELLAEEEIDHDHACIHGEHDERTPLEAGESADDASTVEETHVIWEVTYEGESGYVEFDAEEHFYDGPFVFYTADGTVEPVDGTELERGAVDDEEYCPSLDEYVEIEVSDDGVIVLEVVADAPIDEYANDDGVIDMDGLQAAVDDWRVGNLDEDQLHEVGDAWETGERVD